MAHQITQFGDRRDDPYAWMHDGRNRQELLALMAAENRFADSHFEQSGGLQKTLMEEFELQVRRTQMRGASGAGDGRHVAQSGDQKDWGQKGGYQKQGVTYWRETRHGYRHPFFMRSNPAGETAEQTGELLLDVNPLAEGFEYFELGHFDLNVAGRLLLTRDTTGDQRYELLFQQRAGGKPFAPRLFTDTAINHVARRAYWDPADDQAFYFLAISAPEHQHRQLYRFQIQTGEAQLLHEEKDPSFQLHLFRTEDQLYLVSERLQENHLWLIAGSALHRLTAPKSTQNRPSLTRISKRGADLYLLSNWQDASFAIYRTSYRANWDDSFGAPAPQSWQMLYRPNDASIEDFEVLPTGHLAVLERARMNYRIKVLAGDGSLADTIQHAPEDVVSLLPGGGDNLQYKVSSLAKPERTCSHRLSAKAVNKNINKAIDKTIGPRREAHQQGTADCHHAEPGQVTLKRLWFTSDDGTSVPITLAFSRQVASRKGIKKGKKLSQRPILIQAYGAYGINANIQHDPHKRSLLDRGLILASIHVRGGGELGLPWHQAATGLAKHRSLTDLLAGIRFLAEAGYGDPAKRLARGASAGGALIAAAMMQEPSLFAAVVLARPFVDLLNTLSDASAPLVGPDRLEWGDPSHRAGYFSVKRLSPYENVRHQAYPPLYVTASLNDSRVRVQEPLKWLARLRQHQQGDAPLLVQVDMASGHGGTSDQHERQLALAREYAFIMGAAGISH